MSAWFWDSELTTCIYIYNYLCMYVHTYVIVMNAHVIFYTLVTGRCPFDSDVKCNDTGRCLRSNYICDGYSHCRYGNDEENCGNEYYIYIHTYVQ